MGNMNGLGRGKYMEKMNGGKFKEVIEDQDAYFQFFSLKEATESHP